MNWTGKPDVCNVHKNTIVLFEMDVSFAKGILIVKATLQLSVKKRITIQIVTHF